MIEHWRKWTGEARSQIFVDWAPALGLMLFTQFSIWVQPTTGQIPGPKMAAAILYLVMTVSLGYRRKAPVVALVAVLGACAWEILRLDESHQGSFEAFLSLCIATYAVGAYSGSRVSLATGLLLPAIVPISDSIHRQIAFQSGHLISEIFPFWIWSATFCLIGRGVRTRYIMLGLLTERASRLEREREEKARIAVAEERARIARDLHDVVAHGVSMMVVQAGAARRVLANDPAAATSALLSVESTGRQALGEMRRLLGIMRTNPGSLDLAPQPGLARLPELVGEVNKAGLEVHLRSEGAQRELPAGVDLVAYRVVQEGLTNVIKHAAGAKAWVTVRFAELAVELGVRDDGTGAVTGIDGAGHGLFGMRERIGLYGGSLVAGPGESGGFVLRASIPTAGAA